MGSCKMINLYNQDCMVAMADMADNQYDLAIVDPPYGIGIDKRFHENGANNWGGFAQYRQTEWDNATPEQAYFTELLRVSKNQVIWGGNYFADKVPPSQMWLIWDKKQRGFSMADAEIAYTSFNRAIRTYVLSRGTALAEHRRTGAMFHPTRKPVMLYEWVLSICAVEGDKILDTHAGSASLALACHNMGYSLDAYEIDPVYHAQATERLKQHQKQHKLF